MNELSINRFTHMPISSANFGIDMNETLTIITQGIYTFVDDIEFKPSYSMPAIMIKSEGVILDLDGHKLVQGNDIDGCDGIKICAGSNHTNVINGTISNFTKCGIIVGDSDGIHTHDILLKDLTLYEFEPTDKCDNHEEYDHHGNNDDELYNHDTHDAHDIFKDELCIHAANLIKRYIREYVKFKNELMTIYI
jgi:hypothetical protein